MKKVWISGVIIAVIMGTLLLIGFVQKKETGEMLKVLSDNVDLKISDFHYTEVGDPDLKWEIKADSAEYMKKEKKAYLHNIRVKVITSESRVTNLKGNEGYYYTDTKDITVLGNVIIVSDKGEELLTDRLNYSNVDRKIYTESKVIMKNSCGRISGEGMDYHLDKRYLKLYSKVHAIIDGNSDIEGEKM